MRDRSEVLKKRRSILLVGTILIAAVPFSGAFAAEQGAPAASEAAPGGPEGEFFAGLGGGGGLVLPLARGGLRRPSVSRRRNGRSGISTAAWRRAIASLAIGRGTDSAGRRRRPTGSRR